MKLREIISEPPFLRGAIAEDGFSVAGIWRGLGGSDLCSFILNWYKTKNNLWIFAPKISLLLVKQILTL
jgi:hypothetical protein